MTFKTNVNEKLKEILPRIFNMKVKKIRKILALGGNQVQALLLRKIKTIAFRAILISKAKDHHCRDILTHYAVGLSASLSIEDGQSNNHSMNIIII